jgi:hypothetical protein
MDPHMQTRFSMIFAALLLIAGCGEAPNRKATFPVKGKITVDGQAPGTAIRVECVPVAGLDTKDPTVSGTECDPEGNFEISTYQQGDGVPPGDYVLTFTWQEFNMMQRQYTGKDKLNGRYSDPKSPTAQKVSVKEGTPTDLGVIALTTK